MDNEKVSSFTLSFLAFLMKSVSILGCILAFGGIENEYTERTSLF